MPQLAKLQQQLNALAQQAESVDKQRGESYRPLFDQSLFRCLSRYLSPCVNESLELLKTLQNEKQLGRLSSNHAEYLCGKLINQVAAIQREIATITIRRNEKLSANKPSVEIHQLYQNLAQHQNWQRQLEQKIRDAEQKLELNPTASNHREIKQYILTTEKRLDRCKDSTKKIEKQILEKERTH